MKNKLYKKIIVCLMTLGLLIANAMPIMAYTKDNCPNKKYHNTYNSNYVELYNEIIPDYSVGQFHVISYYYCKTCGFAWDINDEYVGSLSIEMPKQDK